jgi:polyhydroxybutyrate depolymerase
MPESAQVSWASCEEDGWPWPPERSVSILALHGTADGQVSYQGGATSGSPAPVPSQPDLIDAWAERNGCPSSSEEETHGLVTTTWRDCRAVTSVRLITVRDGGRTWLSADFDGPVAAVDATQAFTEYFELQPA